MELVFLSEYLSRAVAFGLVIHIQETTKVYGKYQIMIDSRITTTLSAAPPEERRLSTTSRVKKSKDPR